MRRPESREGKAMTPVVAGRNRDWKVDGAAGNRRHKEVHMAVKVNWKSPALEHFKSSSRASLTP